MNFLSKRRDIAKAQGDTEYNQAFIRIAIISIIFIYQLTNIIVNDTVRVLFCL